MIDDAPRFPASPLDGLVHLVQEVIHERGSRIITVKCGVKMPLFFARDRLTGACGWNSAVTCPECRWP